MKIQTEDRDRQSAGLASPLPSRYGLGEIVGQSHKMRELYDLILEVAPSEAGVLITGESGTGKELAARAVHRLGPRKSNPFLPVNCGGIPGNLVESEFFGYKKGAFSGAHIDKSGFLEIADKGTLFLDEIGEINVSMQVKLLRALDGDGYTPLGSNLVLKPEIRIISATNRDLRDLVQKGGMRPDFFYRINVVPLYLPPLRERREDIPLLIRHFLEKFDPDQTLPRIPGPVMARLEQHDWPGNIRELQNIIHRYAALKRLDVFDLFFENRGVGKDSTPDEPGPEDLGLNLSQAMAQFEKRILLHHLEKNRWNQTRVASFLGINRKTLHSKIKKYRLEKV
ncbi:sigma-54 interaction domain-containing protein [Desulfospira joergensenii]|uniref:sigma-54 interaction domain-containing protein n=1 Tax=Desulfospira joergensenii TaxID=53329 RepID=UPI0013772D6D|nr:sigma-54 dependent transcriptional regulator [Desulfospira joergensenii]